MSDEARQVRRYRLLLLAYPGRFRRRRGTEMITTMLELGEPSRSDAWHLIASGVRERFRLPSGRPFTVVGALLVTLALGMFGAAAGSWLGSPGLPARSEVMHLVNPAVSNPMASFSHRTSWSGRADSLNFTLAPKAQQPSWTVEDARTGLIAAGWTITEFTADPRPASITCTTDDICTFDSSSATVLAERDGLVLSGTATDFLADKTGTAWIGGLTGSVVVGRGAVYLPLTIAGGLLGALTGWLLTAAFAYRIRSRPLAAVFTGVAMTVAAPPVWALIVNAVMLGQHLSGTGLVYTLHAALLPDSHLDGVPAWLIPACAIAAAAIAIGVLVLSTDREDLPGATRPT
ncbi:hypothetical protein [Paractinoplanes lichenicola]|uniref:ABC transporter permease n=1 Tax=Paractinoplanes lichenicola TaxID=2802976 RepID=A0ABS1VGU2_9ACTN|nr:hypothetical protein [Actinoplanes lichenicola]MBL7253893.1 hypothetical protein [Actinoplanes lichenicola]